MDARRPAPGDRVELVSTNDPHTLLRPGDRGTVLSLRPDGGYEVEWRDGSRLTMLPDSGDVIRLVGAARPCPRCKRPLPTQHLGALSRFDDQTEVCSDCGAEEAALAERGTTLTGPAEWPVKRLLANCEHCAGRITLIVGVGWRHANGRPECPGGYTLANPAHA